MKTDREAIEELHATWIEAVNAGNLERLLGLITDDVVLINPGRAPFGRGVFVETFLSAHRALRLRCTSDLEEVVVEGTVAYARSRDALTFVAREGGEAGELEGHRLTIYRRQGNGRWLLARDAHTLAPVKR